MTALPRIADFCYLEQLTLHLCDMTNISPAVLPCTLKTLRVYGGSYPATFLSSLSRLTNLQILRYRPDSSDHAMVNESSLLALTSVSALSISLPFHASAVGELTR
jgi:hypothetical protein